MTVPGVLVHRDATMLARAVAARLVPRLVDAESARGGASIVLTGGSVISAALAELAAAPAHDAIPWKRLDVWWGDENFLPSGHAERNDTQARAALLGSVDVTPAHVHPMAVADEPGGGGPEVAAEQYATELWAAMRPEDHGPVPSFDVLLLDVGADGRVAALFPEKPALYELRPVVAVRGAPEPSAVRLTLTLPAIQNAREVWIVAAGQHKAAAVRMALAGSGPVQVPASGARGWQRTLFLLDQAAASQVPPGLRLPAAP